VVVSFKGLFFHDVKGFCRLLVFVVWVLFTTGFTGLKFRLLFTPVGLYYMAYFILSRALRAIFFLKTDNGYPMDTWVTLSTLATLRIPSAITPLGQLYQSPPSLIQRTGRAASGGALALEPPRATRNTPEFIRIFCFLAPLFIITCRRHNNSSLCSALRRVILSATGYFF